MTFLSHALPSTPPTLLNSTKLLTDQFTVDLWGGYSLFMSGGPESCFLILRWEKFFGEYTIASSAWSANSGLVSPIFAATSQNWNKAFEERILKTVKTHFLKCAFKLTFEGVLFRQTQFFILGLPFSHTINLQMIVTEFLKKENIYICQRVCAFRTPWCAHCE